MVKCFTDPRLDVFQLDKAQTDVEDRWFHLASAYNSNLTRPRNVKDIPLPVQVVPTHATLDEAIDIFDRVNSQGTKLTDAFVRCREFLNADLIAAGLSPFAPETQDIRAGRLLLIRIRELTAARETFGFETTLSGRGYVRLFKKMRRDGYRVVVFFLWLPSADIAVARVRERVAQGGHDVPTSTVRRRYQSGLRNAFRLYRPLADMWRVYDASYLPPRIVAHEEMGETEVLKAALLEVIMQEMRR